MSDGPGDGWEYSRTGGQLLISTYVKIIDGKVCAIVPPAGYVRNLQAQLAERFEDEDETIRGSFSNGWDCTYEVEEPWESAPEQTPVPTDQAAA